MGDQAQGQTRPLVEAVERLGALASWMRAHGAVRAKVGDLELELSPEFPGPRDVAPRKPKTEAEMKIEALDAKRRRYRMELGYTPTDSFLASLP